MSSEYMTCVGLSHDNRTNRWRITCLQCEKKFEPRTTMLSVDVITCPKCESDMLVDYNQESINLIKRE